MHLIFPWPDITPRALRGHLRWPKLLSAVPVHFKHSGGSCNHPALNSACEVRLGFRTTARLRISFAITLFVNNFFLINRLLGCINLQSWWQEYRKRCFSVMLALNWSLCCYSFKSVFLKGGCEKHCSKCTCQGEKKSSVIERTLEFD